ncbi:MAG: beta-galactosidase [Anaerolineae bacterium]
MPLYLGAAWYPEHWPESRWPEDLRLMREAGLNVVRVGEFAWSTMEPHEGQFDFGWLERAVALAGEQGIAVVMGTPTAAPPAWLTSSYPETLAVDEHGRVAQHGKRCHFDVTSETYKRLCRGVTEELARRFGPDERVIGWQLDNEYNRISYSAGARRAFQQWLQTLYVDAEGRPSLQALNDAWAASYWSESYSSWSQIPLPAEGGHNPGLILKAHQFVTHAYREYQRLQIEAIRAQALPSQWISSNFMGFFPEFDHYDICADLDLASWDHYIGTGHADLARTGAPHDLTRGFKRRNFWVMETQPGSVNWAPINNQLNKGEGRAMAWNGIGHGADAILYWQWRNAPNGQEQYHGSLLANDGTPRPFYTEVQRLAADFRAVGGLLDGAEVAAPVALLHSYDDRWSIEAQRHTKDYDPVEHLMHYYTQFSRRNIATDIISSRATLAGHRYKLVVAPVHIVDDAIVAELSRFVAEGGHLILTERSGFKDADNSLLPERQPGPLRSLAGMHVEEYFALDQPAPVQLLVGERHSGQARVWAEWLAPDEGTEVLATYRPGNGWLDGRTAITMRRHGDGCVYYVGAWLDAALQTELLGWIIEQARVAPVLAGMPEGVQALRRGDVYIVVNGTPSEQPADLPWTADEHLSGQSVSRLRLDPYGIAVLTRQ